MGTWRRPSGASRIGWRRRAGSGGERRPGGTTRGSVVAAPRPVHNHRAMFELQPTLKGDLLELRPLRPEDYAALFAVASAPLIWELHPEQDRWREERFRVFFDEGLASGGALLALDRTHGQVIGSSRFHGHDPARREIEVGWTFLARAYWGGRYNGEMK